jgi:hypothetical protein
VADERSALHNLIRRGRRRQALHLVIHAASFAAVVALGGAIVLLIVGAQILNWYWLVLLFAGSLAASAYRSRTRLLSEYRVAQSIDHQFGYKDALSTAYYFSHHPERASSPEFVEQQRQGAEEMARSADIERGVPFRMPRTAYVNLALVAVAFGMLGLRYGIHRSLDLGSPLVHIDFDGLFGTSPQDAKARPGKRLGDGHGEPGAAVDPLQAKTNDMDPAPDAALQSVENPDQNNASTSPDASAKADAKNTEQLPPGSNPLDSGEKGEKSDASQTSDANANPSSSADSKSGQQNGSKEAKDAKDANSGSSGDNSSLANKLRDALSNLLAKMKPQSKPGGGKPVLPSKVKSRKAIRNRPARSRLTPARIRNRKATSSRAGRSKPRRARAKGAAIISPTLQTARAASASRTATRPLAKPLNWLPWESLAKLSASARRIFQAR